MSSFRPCLSLFQPWAIFFSTCSPSFPFWFRWDLLFNLGSSFRLFDIGALLTSTLGPYLRFFSNLVTFLQAGQPMHFPLGPPSETGGRPPHHGSGRASAQHYCLCMTSGVTKLRHCYFIPSKLANFCFQFWLAISQCNFGVCVAVEKAWEPAAGLPSQN